MPFGVDLSPSSLFCLIPFLPTQHLNLKSSNSNVSLFFSFVHFKKVTDYINADVYITQEFSNEGGVNNFLDK